MAIGPTGPGADGVSAEEQAWSLVLLDSSLDASVTGSTLWCDQGVTLGVATGALPRHR